MKMETIQEIFHEENTQVRNTPRRQYYLKNRDKYNQELLNRVLAEALIKIK